MTKRFKHSLVSWFIYTLMTYIVLFPCQLGILSSSISILVGFLFGILNDILTELRKSNGEKFPEIEDKPVKKKDVLLKS